MDVEPCIELPPAHVRPADAEPAQSRRRDDRGYGGQPHRQREQHPADGHAQTGGDVESDRCPT